MKKIIFRLMLLASLTGTFGCSSDPSSWSDEKINTWFENGEWLNGWKVKPDESVNRREFAVSYHKNKERWDKAFTFLANSDLASMEIKRYEIDGDNAYAPISEYPSKKEEDGKYEVHRKYIDIQYVIKGVEKIGVTPLANKKVSTVPYDEAKDIEFMTVTDSTYHQATPENFFIFFPSEIHKPGIRTGQDSVMIKKVVVKIKVD
jgi:YhcH/YjgK/YiaL family protein